MLIYEVKEERKKRFFLYRTLENVTSFRTSFTMQDGTEAFLLKGMRYTEPLEHRSVQHCRLSSTKNCLKKKTEK